MEDKTYRLSLKLSDGTTQSADFTIPGDDAVLYTAQTLTDEQKVQARENIGAADAEEFSQLSAEIGDIDTALDNIIALQNSYIGGDGE